MWNRTLIALISAFLFIGCEEESTSSAAASKENYQAIIAHSKSLAPLEVKIKVIGEIPARETGVTTVEATISILNNITEPVEWRWVVSEDSTVVKGLLSGSFSGTKGTTQTVQLELTNFSKLRQKELIIQVSSQFGGRKVSASDIILSQPEKSLESNARELKKAADQQLQD